MCQQPKVYNRKESSKSNMTALHAEYDDSKTRLANFLFYLRRQHGEERVFWDQHPDRPVDQQTSRQQLKRIKVWAHRLIALNGIPSSHFNLSIFFDFQLATDLKNRQASKWYWGTIWKVVASTANCPEETPSKGDKIVILLQQPGCMMINSCLRERVKILSRKLAETKRHCFWIIIRVEYSFSVFYIRVSKL